MIVPQRWPGAASLALGATLASACREPSAGAAETVLERTEPTVFVLRVLAGAAPLAGAEVEVETEWRARWSSVHAGAESSTDETGRLRVTVEPRTEVDWSFEHPFSLDPRQFTTAEEELHLTVRTGELWGEIVLAGPIAPGEVELDPLVLRPMEVLASGRVLDAPSASGTRAPVAGADVALACLPFRHMSTWRATSGADGAFAVRAPPGERSGELALVAWKDERFSAPQEVAPGVTGVDVTLSVAPERVTGRVHLDPEVPAESLSIYLDPLEAPYRQLVLETAAPLDFGVVLDPDGRFALRCLPGEHRLRILGGWEDLVESSVVRIGPDGAVHEQLASIDLRGRVRALTLTLVPPEPGTEVVGSWIAYAPEDRSGAIVHFRGETVRIVTAHPEPSVELELERFRPVTLERVDGDRTVVLEPGWPVRIVLMDHVPLPEPPVRWTVVLRHEESGSFTTRFPFAPGEREARGLVTRTGRHELDWIRVEAHGDDVRASAWGGRREGPQQALIVRDAPEEQVFEIAWVPAPR